ncbi:acyl carrier protein [Amycolatopsis pithecellobii]|uniref:Acyl carrier protein n=1 Tax=Amycolatopsis pithecellobii TaxID=664692 RepID=A0A6N7ZCQ0_9PSEU|nr:acyl carrier protein [Amycolatopsis pithecellobii]MTD59475.1 acyl carrier protein [Amycolatopsis pithecellobii]
MSEPSIEDIRKIVSDTFLLDPALVEPDTPLEELGIDSKGRIRLLATLEVFYEVTIDLDERDRLTDVAAVAAVLREAIRNKPGETAAS